MRTTKYDWLCVVRTFNFPGEFDPGTSSVTGIEDFRQEQWIKAFYRPFRDGNKVEVGKEIVPGGQAWIYKPLNAGSLFVRNIPSWPTPVFTRKNGKPFKPKVSDGFVFIYWPAPTVTFDAGEAPNLNTWVPIVSVSNVSVGTRFDKHYEVLISSNIEGYNVIKPAVSSPPQTEPLTVETFEQAEARLNTVINIGSGIIKKAKE